MAPPTPLIVVWKHTTDQNKDKVVDLITICWEVENKWVLHSSHHRQVVFEQIAMEMVVHGHKHDWMSCPPPFWWKAWWNASL